MELPVRPGEIGARPYNRPVDLEIDIDAEHRDAVTWIGTRVREEGGRALLVGGCVRDALMGRAVDDLDVEVFGIQPERLHELLKERFAVDLVGESFGVIKLRGMPIDVALPRRESKTGRGHRGFEIDSDPHMSIRDAAARRDFTINAISYDPLSLDLFDPYEGRDDLRARLLRHTSERFAEDPLRVHRGAQLAARFELRAVAPTLELCRSMTPEGLAPERIFEEWRKLLLKGVRPSLGFSFLRDCDWIRHFPELERLIGCPQDPEWHPEGDVWRHTLYVLDAFAEERVGDPWEDLVVGLACLCHDLGKPETTRWQEGRWRSRGHEAAGEARTRSLLARISRHRDLVEAVVPLVVDHLKPRQLHEGFAGDAAIRRLARRVGRIDRLVRLARADTFGRPGGDAPSFPEGPWLLERARSLEVEARSPEPIVKGRHLIEQGLEPGPHFAGLLGACFDAQIEGAFDDLEGGRRFLHRLLAGRSRATGAVSDS